MALSPAARLNSPTAAGSRARIPAPTPLRPSPQLPVQARRIRAPWGPPQEVEHRSHQHHEGTPRRPLTPGSVPGPIARHPATDRPGLDRGPFRTVPPGLV